MIWTSQEALHSLTLSQISVKYRAIDKDEK